MEPARPRPPRRPPPAGLDRPLWKSPWLWVGIGGLALLGAGAGYAASQQGKGSGQGFTVTLVPAGN